MSIKDAQRFHKNRSQRAQTIDDQKQHKKQLPPTKENVARWKKRPGRSDIIGVDDLSKVVSVKKKPVKKKVKPVLPKEAPKFKAKEWTWEELTQPVPNYNKWQLPDEKELKKEFKIEHELKGKKIFKSEKEFIDFFLAYREESFVDKDLDQLIVGRSYRKDYKSLIALLKTYKSWPEFRNEETTKNLYKRFQLRQPLDMPIVFLSGTGYRIFSGNTRMDVANQLGAPIKVVILDLDQLPKFRENEEFLKKKKEELKKKADTKVVPIDKPSERSYTERKKKQQAIGYKTLPEEKKKVVKKGKQKPLTPIQKYMPSGHYYYSNLGMDFNMTFEITKLSEIMKEFHDFVKVPENYYSKKKGDMKKIATMAMLYCERLYYGYAWSGGNGISRAEALSACIIMMSLCPPGARVGFGASEMIAISPDGVFLSAAMNNVVAGKSFEDQYKDIEYLEKVIQFVLNNATYMEPPSNKQQYFTTLGFSGVTQAQKLKVAKGMLEPFTGDLGKLKEVYFKNTYKTAFASDGKQALAIQLNGVTASTEQDMYIMEGTGDNISLVPTDNEIKFSIFEEARKAPAFQFKYPYVKLMRMWSMMDAFIEYGIFFSPNGEEDISKLQPEMMFLWTDKGNGYFSCYPCIYPVSQMRVNLNAIAKYGDDPDDDYPFEVKVDTSNTGNKRAAIFMGDGPFTLLQMPVYNGMYGGIGEDEIPTAWLPDDVIEVKDAYPYVEKDKNIVQKKTISTKKVAKKEGPMAAESKFPYESLLWGDRNAYAFDNEERSFLDEVAKYGSDSEKNTLDEKVTREDILEHYKNSTHKAQVPEAAYRELRKLKDKFPEMLDPSYNLLGEQESVQNVYRATWIPIDAVPKKNGWRKVKIESNGTMDYYVLDVDENIQNEYPRTLISFSSSIRKTQGFEKSPSASNGKVACTLEVPTSSNNLVLSYHYANATSSFKEFEVINLGNNMEVSKIMISNYNLSSLKNEATVIVESPNAGTSYMSKIKLNNAKKCLELVERIEKDTEGKDWEVYGQKVDQSSNFNHKNTVTRIRKKDADGNITQEVFQQGGMTYGPSHAQGGIPAVNNATGQMLELEGGEGIVNKSAMSSPEPVNLDGQQMTVCEAVSDLNQRAGNGRAMNCE